MGTDNRYQSVLNTLLGQLQSVSEFAAGGSLPITTFAGGSVAEQSVEVLSDVNMREMPFMHVGMGPQGTVEVPVVVQQDLWTCQASIVIMLAPSGERITRLHGNQLPAAADQKNNLLLLSYLSRLEEVMSIMPLHNDIDWGFTDSRPQIARTAGDFVPIEINNGTVVFDDFLLSFEVPYRRGVNYDYSGVRVGDFDGDFDGDFN